MELSDKKAKKAYLQICSGSAGILWNVFRNAQMYFHFKHLVISVATINDLFRRGSI